MTPQRENQMALAELIGISEEDAISRLDRRVCISYGQGVSDALGIEIAEYLERTVVLVDPGENADLEIIVGSVPRHCAEKKAFVSLTPLGVTISSSGDSLVQETPPLPTAIAAAYVAGFALSRVLGLEETHSPDDPLVVRFTDLGLEAPMLELNVTLNDTVLVGAGAIGNAFLRALRCVQVRGELTIADPKNVGPGNANRCLYFGSGSSGNKAQELASRAQPDFSELRLNAFVGTLGEIVSARGRVRRVIVAADSRRARRSIQAELPLEVLDASTSGTDEIVVHSNHGVRGGACLSCVYKHVPDEAARERDIASGLGISLEEVAKERIDEDIARKIVSHHPHLDAAALIGTSFDSLFKQLCATQGLLLGSGQQVLAPFAFVSGLAGALLVVELLRYELSINRRVWPPSEVFFINPWRAPNPQMRRSRGKDPACDFCGNPQKIQAMSDVWSDVLSHR